MDFLQEPPLRLWDGKSKVYEADPNITQQERAVAAVSNVWFDADTIAKGFAIL